MAATDSTKTSANGNGDAGTPTDAFEAIAAALAKASPATSSDPDVPHAIAVGWHAQEAFAAALIADSDKDYAARPGASPYPAHFLTDEDNLIRPVSQLTSRDRVILVCAQLNADIKSLTPRLEATGQDPAVLNAGVGEVLSSRPCEEAARSLASQLAGALLAADFRLGKAFALGWDTASLNQIEGIDLPGSLSDSEARTRFIARFTQANAAGALTGRLTDLASLLPPHVGHAVRASVQTWQDTIAPHTTEGLKGKRLKQANALRSERAKRLAQVTRSEIFDQVQRWRSLLTAEKAAKDVLDSDSLVQISAGTMRRLAAAIRDGARKTGWILVLLGVAIVALAAAGVWLLTSSSGATTAAGVTALIGSVGLTWKTVGSTIGSGLARLEQPAWEAEVDAAIAAMVTTLTDSNPTRTWKASAVKDAPKPGA
jgi:hypothetical protein